MIKHQKKRNTGLLYEFLVRAISSYLVEGNNAKSSQALKILKKYYNKDTQLYNEFKLINALVKTHVRSENTASSLLGEAKNVARKLNHSQIDKEKSNLIRDINHQLNDPMFYDRTVNEYRIYATSNVLIKEWNSQHPDLEKLALYEEQVARWLTTEKKEEDSTLLEGSTGSNRLLIKVMLEKLNKKYEGVFNNEQKDICKSYLWSVTKDDFNIVSNKLKSVTESLISTIDDYKLHNSTNTYICEKLNDVKNKLLTESFDSVDDSQVVRYMQYIKLKEELVGDSNDK